MDDIFNQQFQSAVSQISMRMMQQAMDGLKSGASSSANVTQAPWTGTSATGSPSGGQFSDLIEQACRRYGVNPNLVSAVIQAESGFNPQAVSGVGAQGLMQLMPGTAQQLGVTNALDPAQNIDGGVHFLRQLLDHYSGNVSMAVAAYNAGPGAVDQYKGIPPYAETQTYVQRVMGYFENTHRWEV